MYPVCTTMFADPALLSNTCDSICSSKITFVFGNCSKSFFLLNVSQHRTAEEFQKYRIYKSIQTQPLLQFCFKWLYDTRSSFKAKRLSAQHGTLEKLSQTRYSKNEATMYFAWESQELCYHSYFFFTSVKKNIVQASIVPLA